MLPNLNKRRRTNRHPSQLDPSSRVESEGSPSLLSFLLCRVERSIEYTQNTVRQYTGRPEWLVVRVPETIQGITFWPAPVQNISHPRDQGPRDFGQLPKKSRGTLGRAYPSI